MEHTKYSTLLKYINYKLIIFQYLFLTTKINDVAAIIVKLIECSLYESYENKTKSNTPRTCSTLKWLYI